MRNVYGVNYEPNVKPKNDWSNCDVWHAWKSDET